MVAVINGSSLSAKNNLASSGEWQKASKGGSASFSILKGPQTYLLPSLSEAQIQGTEHCYANKELEIMQQYTIRRAHVE